MEVLKMNAEELKEYLKEDVERIEKVLESIGCHRIWRTGSEIRCAPPRSQNHTSISVNIETLFCKYYKEGDTFRGDIFSFLQYMRNESFSDSFRFTRSIFGLSGRFTKETKIDPLAKFKRLRSQTKTVVDVREREIPKFGQEAISDFVQLPHINLFYEGITPQVSEQFQISYDDRLDRIVFPHFHYDDINAIVGITGRTLRSAEEMKQFMIPKYFNYIKGYMKTWNLYGFSHGIEYIKENNMIIIFEAEKSVLKHYSQKRGKGFSVATGGHEISNEQVQIILQNTPADVEVVIAFDKDVMAMKDENGGGAGEEFLMSQCDKFAKYRKTSYIFDTYNILGEKDSPIDKGVKIFNHLLKFRKQYKTKALQLKGS